MSLLPVTPCIQPNPDISGIGVRVAIYAQAFLSIIRLLIFTVDGEITIEEGRAIKDIAMTNELTGCALLVSAVIQARTYGLSVYHANITLVLNWITFVPYGAALLFGAMGNKKPTDGNTTNADRRPKRGMPLQAYLIIVILWMHYIAIGGLGIWLWSDIKSFGDQPECTPQTFVVIFGFNILVTKKGLKIVALYIYGSVALSAVAFPFIFLYMWYKLRRHTSVLEPSSDANPHNQNQMQKRFKKSWFALLFFALGIEILLVACTEILIWRSRGLVHPGESQWTFGQSLAVFLVLIPLVGTIGESQEGYNEWRKMKRKGRGVPGAAQEEEVYPRPPDLTLRDGFDAAGTEEVYPRRQFEYRES